MAGPGGPPGHAPYPGCETGGVEKKYDREKMADDLIEWVHDEDNWDIKAWRVRHMISRKLVKDLCDSSDKFLNAYAYAFDVIALRRTKMNHLDEMKDSLYSLHARVYDKDLDDQKKDEKKYEIEARQAALNKELQTVSSEINEKYDAVMDQLSSLQNERKIVDTNISAETKS